MRVRPLGETSMDVSALCLGTMTFGWTADEAASFAIMSEAIEHGVNLFDTADIYSRWSPSSYPGKTEEIIGRWLAEDLGRRGRVYLATKVRGPMSERPEDQGLGRRHLVSAVEGSLRRLRTDHLDLYQAHWFDEQTAQEETLRALDDLTRSGKVRAIGCSNFTAAQLGAALAASDRDGFARYETLQPHYNLVHREEYERELAPLCVTRGLGVLPYSPLAGGFLTGKYRPGGGAPRGSRGEHSQRIAQYVADPRCHAAVERLGAIARERGVAVSAVALAWVIDAPAVASAIVGANSVGQLRESLPAGDLVLSADERRDLDA